jgi:hypothetical protein
MTDRTFGQIMAILAEHDETNDLTGVIVNDAFIDLVCHRLASLAVPPVDPAEVRRAWDQQRTEMQGPRADFFNPPR